MERFSTLFVVIVTLPLQVHQVLQSDRKKKKNLKDGLEVAFIFACWGLPPSEG